MGEDHILADPEAYATDLYWMERSGAAVLASVLSRVREILREDDRHMVEALAGRHRGGDEAVREEGIAHILSIPRRCANCAGSTRSACARRARATAGTKAAAEACNRTPRRRVPVLGSLDRPDPFTLPRDVVFPAPVSLLPAELAVH